MGIEIVRCHFARCDQCGEGFGDDEMLIHYDEREKLNAALAEQGWIVADGRVLCAQCVGANSCELIGHRLNEWWPIETPRYSGRMRDCECCGYAEFDPPQQAAKERLA